MNPSVKPNFGTGFEAKPTFNFARLRHEMLRKGFTQERLARETGVTLRAAQKWTAGQVVPSGDKRIRIAEVFGKPPEWFWESDDHDDLPTAA